ncbi:MAG: M28 family metallopeptidase [Chloroflexi bacterium]|nr:M28 family metallopeptidase [Chloroflexota bacterium]MDA1298065.1 M28 family metallopeptidase [Chloroflexota bacterium]
MARDWHQIDRFLMGEAWAGSRIPEYRDHLCHEIGERWGGGEGDQQAAMFIRQEMEGNGLESARIEEFKLDTWEYSSATAVVLESGESLEIKPFLRCPPIDMTAPVVDLGWGTPREIEAADGRIRGAIVVMSLGPEPFTPPLPHTARLELAARNGAVAAIVIESKTGGRMEYRSANDWRSPGIAPHPLPTVNISFEAAGRLKYHAARGRAVRLRVESRFFDAPANNVIAEIPGDQWSDEHVIVAGHHDTVFGTPGGNDNTSGTVAVMEAARVLAALKRETGVGPGRSIRFATWSGEEQGLQGAYAYVARHHGKNGLKSPPRFALNLDELSTGHMKGVVVMTEHMRSFMQGQLDTMSDSLQCHVQGPLDAHSDHFPFVRAAIPAGILWRWRFSGRHATSEFHHESGDSAEKLNVRELKEYVGQICRLMLRLSHVPPEQWPDNPHTADEMERRAAAEIGTHTPTFHG